MKKIGYILIIAIAIVLAIYKCGGCSSNSSDYNSNETESTTSELSSSSETSEIPQWLIGDWDCSTPYGTMHVSFYNDGTCFDSNDGAGTFEFRGNDIVIRYPNQSVSTTIKVHGHSLEAGEGYYYSKR